MLKTATSKGNDSIILGAISCGAFKFQTNASDEIQLINPDIWTVECVTAAYRQAFQELNQEGILGKLKQIAFAVTGEKSLPNVSYFETLAKDLAQKYEKKIKLNTIIKVF